MPVLLAALCALNWLVQPRAAYDDHFAAWSPGGDRIVFVSDRDGDDDIYTVGLEGRELRRLTAARGRDAHPAWSPDGRRIAFQSNRAGKDTRLYLMNRDGSGQRAITDNTGFCGVPAWSPDGRTLAYQCAPAAARLGTADAPWRLFTLPLDGGAPVLRSHGPGNDQVPNWSPDGKSLVFFSDRSGVDQVYVMDVATGGVRALTSGPAVHRVAAFSPDGRSIALISDREGEPGDVYVMRSDGTDLRRLTRTGAQYGVPFFSPDGRWVLFQSMSDQSARISIAAVDGTGTRTVPTGGR